MSATPPSDEAKTTIVTTECPVPECPFVSVFEYNGDPYEGAREVRDHLNEDHETWEIPSEDISDLIENTEGGDSV